MIKILLPTDFLKASVNAIEYALNFASGSKKKLILYHSFIPIDSAFYGSPEFRKKEIIKTEQALKKRIENLKAKLHAEYPGCMLETCIDKGAETRQIISYSKKKKNDLTVMTTIKRKSFINRFFHSSLTKKMASHTRIPLLAIPVKEI